MAAVGEANRVEVARLGIRAIGRRFDRDLLADREEVFLPARSPQSVRRPHLAAMLGDLAVGVGHLEVEPGVGVDELEPGQLAGVGDAFVELERPEAVMGRDRRGRCQKKGDSAYQSNHGGMINRLAAHALPVPTSSCFGRSNPLWSHAVPGRGVIDRPRCARRHRQITKARGGTPVDCSGRPVATE